MLSKKGRLAMAEVNWRDLYEEKDCDGDKIIDVWFVDGIPYAYRYIRDIATGEMATSLSTIRLIPKPKPKSYRPFKVGEVKCGDVFAHKITKAQLMVTGVQEREACLNGYDVRRNWQSFDDIFYDYTKLDGSPAGALE
jgi:hypothetical protein